MICTKCYKEYSSRFCPNCYPFENGSSKGECELYDILLTTGLNIIHNDRKELNGKEIDIYFPDIKFAIEYDGKHWHSEEKDLIKNKLCLAKGIYLIRVDDSDFKKNKDEIINKILFILNTKYNLNVRINSVESIIRVSGKCRKIICTDTGKIYDNYLEAAREFSCPNPSTITNICSHIKGYNNYKGYHFEWYTGEYIKTEIGYNYKEIHIECIDTGEVFESKTILQNLGVSSIDNCIKENANQITACGLRWKKTDKEITNTDNTEKLIKEYINKNRQIQIKNKKVICEDKEFSSIGEAAEYFKVSKSSVSRCCNRKIKKLRNGLIFKFK